MDDPIYTVNIAAGVLMAATCFGVIAITVHRPDTSHIRAFLAFWGLTAVQGVLDRILTITWVPFYERHDSVGFALDAIGNMSIVIAGFALYRGAKFAWDDRVLHALYWSTLVLFFVEFGLGYMKQDETSLVWQLFYMTPGAFIATVALTFVAITVFREPLVASVRWPLVVLFGLYAYLQIPAYFCDYIPLDVLKDQVLHGKHTIVAFLAATKFGIVLSIVVVVLAHAKVTSPEQAASGARVGLSIMTGALTLVIFFYRYFEVTHLP